MDIKFKNGFTIKSINADSESIRSKLAQLYMDQWDANLCSLHKKVIRILKLLDAKEN